MSQSPRIGAVIRMRSTEGQKNKGTAGLNPLESGQSFESTVNLPVVVSSDTRSQSPRIGAVIRIASLG